MSKEIYTDLEKEKVVYFDNHSNEINYDRKVHRVVNNESKPKDGIWYRYLYDDEMWEITDTKDRLKNKLCVNAYYFNLSRAIERFKKELNK